MTSLDDELTAPEGQAFLLGDEAVVRGALEAGIGAFFTYPGTPASEIGDTFARIHERCKVLFEYSVNEKVALENAIALSHCDYRVMVAMKHVGLNVAMDAFMTFPYLGVEGGAVIVSADDPGCHSSQNEQDNRHVARMAYVPMLEPATPQEAKDLAFTAFELSEATKLPCLLRLTTRIAHMRGLVTFGPLPQKVHAGRRFIKDPFNKVVVPAVARKRHLVLLESFKKAKEIVDTGRFTKLTRGGERLCIVCAGSARNLVFRALQDLDAYEKASVLELLCTWPLPEKTIVRALADFDEILFVEELSPFLEDEVSALLFRHGKLAKTHGKHSGVLPENGELTPDLVTRALEAVLGIEARRKGRPAWDLDAKDLPPRPPILCPGCPHRASYLLLKEALGEDILVATDIGCYTLGLNPPISMADLLVCMGSSISTGASLSAGQDKGVVAVIGDSTFFHNGLSALINAVAQRRKLLIACLDNRTTAMTGFQPHPGAVGIGGQDETVSIEAIARSAGAIVVETIDPLNPNGAIRKIQSAFNADGVSVVVFRSPCPQMAQKASILPRRQKVKVIPELCGYCENDALGCHCGVLPDDGYQKARVRARLESPKQEVLPTPPCTSACPVRLCAQGYVGLVSAGKFAEAYELIRRRIPFPSVCAYVCHRPCEEACAEANSGAPVPIREIKRVAVEQGYRALAFERKQETGKKVAIIGGGPAGLSCAEALFLMGHSPVVFEAGSEPGGMLLQAIPDFRLPKELVRREVKDLEAMGIQINTGVRFGKDIGMDDIFGSGFDALVLAVGLQEGVRGGIEGSDNDNVLEALSYLRKYASSEPVRCAGKVVVVGGGNTAVDSARVAKRLGAKEVEVLYRRTMQEMPALYEEVRQAQDEGIRFSFLVSPFRIERTEEGGLLVLCKRMRLGEPDESGRPRPCPIEGSDFKVQADLVLLALGQKVGYEIEGLSSSMEWFRVKDRGVFQTEDARVFACGDVTYGRATVIDAIAQGKACAYSVDAYLRHSKPLPAPWYRESNGSGARPQNNRSLLYHATSGKMTVEEAIREARRCRQCGMCKNCRACIEILGCPAIVLEDGKAKVIASLCNGCGVCVQICPNGAIRFEG